MAIAIGLMTALFSCKKETKIKDKVSINYSIEGKTYNFTCNVDENGKPIWIETPDNQKVVSYFKAHPTAVTELGENGSSLVYPSQDAYVTKELERVNSRAGAYCSGGKANGTAIVGFYKHIDYNTLLFQRQPDLYDDYTTYYGGLSSDFFANNVSTAGQTIKTSGFKIPYVGNSNNDQISSVLVASTTNDTYIYNKQFTVVLFEHANYGGKALALPSCKQLDVTNLTTYRMVWFFVSWNDKVSSITGYYSLL